MIFSPAYSPIRSMMYQEQNISFSVLTKRVMVIKTTRAYNVYIYIYIKTVKGGSSWSVDMYIVHIMVRYLFGNSILNVSY